MAEHTEVNLEEEYDDWVSDGEGEPVVSLFDPNTVFESTAELVEHHKHTLGFDLRAAVVKVGAAFDKDMGTVMLVNFVRKLVAAGTSQAAVVAAVNQGTFLQDEVRTLVLARP